jgi:hypothetical protein
MLKGAEAPARGRLSGSGSTGDRVVGSQLKGKTLRWRRRVREVERRVETLSSTTGSEDPKARGDVRVDGEEVSHRLPSSWLQDLWDSREPRERMVELGN